MTMGKKEQIKSIWPKGCRVAVTLSFDVDAETLWLSRNPENVNRPVLLSHGAYAYKVAIPRILNVLKRHKILSTFFVPGWVAERHPGLVREIKAQGHEVGHHGYLHEPPQTLTEREERKVLKKGISILNTITHEKPLGYRSPAWEYSPKTLSLLSEHGFTYTSAMMDDEMPYQYESGLVELPVQWILDDACFFLFSPNPPLSRVIASPESVFSIWKSEFDGYYREGHYFLLTMHPQFIGRPHRIQMLEALIRHIQHQKGVWFTRCLDVANHFLATKQ
jgi:peptidoglycan/xylan/chitin deacetylase (PgdA/CDA1 family)